jgi:hypothetical protein
MSYLKISESPENSLEVILKNWGSPEKSVGRESKS